MYKLHVHVDSGTEDDNDVKSVVAEIVDKVIHKIDDKEKDDQDVETVTKDCEVHDKLSDVHRTSIGQMENVVAEPLGPGPGPGPGGGAGVGPGYVKSIDEKCTHNVVVLLHCSCLSLNPFIEFSIRNNSSSSDVLNIQASISISPKFESK